MVIALTQSLSHSLPRPQWTFIFPICLAFDKVFFLETFQLQHFPAHLLLVNVTQYKQPFKMRKRAHRHTCLCREDGEQRKTSVKNSKDFRSNRNVPQSNRVHLVLIRSLGRVEPLCTCFPKALSRLWTERAADFTERVWPKYSHFQKQKPSLTLQLPTKMLSPACPSNTWIHALPDLDGAHSANRFSDSKLGCPLNTPLAIVLLCFCQAVLAKLQLGSHPSSPYLSARRLYLFKSQLHFLLT